MSKSIKKNYIYNVLYQIVIMIAPLITTPYVSRILGADGIGEYSYANSISSYFSLFTVMGISTYGQREISYCRDKRRKRTEVFWNAKFLELLNSLIWLSLYFVLAFKQNNISLYLVLSLNILANTVDVTWLFQGIEEFGIIAFRNLIVKIMGIILIFIFVRKKEDLAIYALIISSLGFLSNLSLWFPATKLVDRPQLNVLNPLYNIKDILSLFIPCIAMEVYSVMDKTMIGLICNNSFESGYYEQASKISRMVLVLVTALGTVMVPRIGYHFEKGDDIIVKQYLERAYKFVWFLAMPLCLGLIIISNSFVPYFLGEGYDGVIPLLYILSFLIIAIGINNVTGMQYLIPTRRQDLFTKSVMIGAVINFLLNLVLIPRYNAIGAAIASVLAEFTVAFIQILMVKDEIKLFDVLIYGRKNRVAALIMMICLIYANWKISSSIINIIIIILAGIMIYFGCLIVLQDAFFISLVKSEVEKVLRKMDILKRK